MSMGISAISNNMSYDPAAMFKKLDANSDGGVTKDEFLAGIKKHKGDADEALTRMFENTDGDGDGIITQTEIDAMMQKMAKNGGAKGPPPSGGVGKASSSGTSGSSSTSYDVRDTNEDGEVSTQEKMDYILKLLQENAASEAVLSEYDQSGESIFSSSSVSTTFSVNA